LPLVVVGIVLGSVGLVGGAFVLFALVAAFHVATLPVELDASRRALSLLAGEGLLVEDELPPARGVLRAAASTYLVAALVAAAEVVWLLLELTGEDD
jgi:Zn-dependent membrane protease YugP